MAQRPQELLPLFGNIQELDGIGPKTARLLFDFGLEKPRDLLFSLPYSGVDRQKVTSVQDVAPSRFVTVEVEIVSHIPSRAKGRPYNVKVADEKMEFSLVFFNARADYLKKQLPEGGRRIISGKLEHFDNQAQIVHPDFILPIGANDEVPAFEPVYHLTQGVVQKTMRKAVTSVLRRVPELPEWIDTNLKTERSWPNWRKAVQQAHEPKNMGDVMAEAPMRQRLAYDEFFAHQLTLGLARQSYRRAKGRKTLGDESLRDKVLKSIPFPLTGAQEKAVKEICDDLAQDQRMSRLLQGDVGSGKTVVAFLALLVAVEAGGQGALMAPTEILARQHLESLSPLADAAGITLKCLTGRDKTLEREAILQQLRDGEIDILVGTHALFQDDVTFADLRLAIIDEQHRFGVGQRSALGAKGKAVDTLVMTATPIPRSLSLAQYGDLDVSILDEKPPGRQPINTAALPMNRINDVVTRLRSAIAEGRQAYWVCPLVEESELSDKTAAETRFKLLRAALGDDTVGVVHGQMHPSQKDETMAAFSAGNLSVLVATTVIEVGVNVPNATIMVIERAEGFGLAQLHQLRGRVGRGDQASTCLLLYQAPLSETAERRLRILRETEDGFRIAEEDLSLRGAGDVIGTVQSGLPKFQIADLERQTSLMATAHKDARKLLEEDPQLSSMRGQAARKLLWLMEQDKAIRLVSIG